MYRSSENMIKWPIQRACAKRAANLTATAGLPITFVHPCRSILTSPRAIILGRCIAANVSTVLPVGEPGRQHDKVSPAYAPSRQRIQSFPRGFISYGAASSPVVEDSIFRVDSRSLPHDAEHVALRFRFSIWLTCSLLIVA